jgi:hypothetical protein
MLTRFSLMVDLKACFLSLEASIAAGPIFLAVLPRVRICTSHSLTTEN